METTRTQYAALHLTFDQDVDLCAHFIFVRLYAVEMKNQNDQPPKAKVDEGHWEGARGLGGGAGPQEWWASPRKVNKMIDQKYF